MDHQAPESNAGINQHAHMQKKMHSEAVQFGAELVEQA